MLGTKQNLLPTCLVKFFVAISLIFIHHSSVYAQDNNAVYCAYKQRDFNGQSYCGNDEVWWVGWSWYRKTASLEVKNGYELEVYPYWGFLGTPTIISGDQARLRGRQRTIGSFRVNQIDVVDDPRVCFYKKKSYRGATFCTSDEQLWLDRSWNDRISSVKIPQGFKVVLYRHYFYRGQSITLTADTPGLTRLNNRVSSIYIERVIDGEDGDNDGVINSQDQCPDTPAGETVDIQGCSPSQLDADNDGITDNLDQCPQTPTGESVNAEGCSSSQLDTDADGVNDTLDQCPNTPSGESVNTDGCSQEQIDTDGDGVPDYRDTFPNNPNESSDIDGDGIGDNTDTDRDGDGISNDYEAQVGTDPNDPASRPADLDGDGIPDSLDDDRDGDGVNNDQDAFPSNPNESSDLDGDGIGDNADTDRDGDGISNAYEVQVGTDPSNAGSTPPDLDVDGIPDSLDNDRDGDGIDNDQDVFPSNPNESSDLDGDGIGDNTDTDRDGDGISNDYETQVGTDPNDPASRPSDLDNDGIPDSLDSDRDGDGVNNDQDAFPDDATEMADLDGDGIGDNTDTDRDGDGISNDYEEQVGTNPNDNTSTPDDLDADGIPDSLDDDRDGDGVNNDQDVFPDDADETTDLDGDGIGDNADTDRDDDGISNDYEEQVGTDPNDNTSTPSDLDTDGIPDSLDDDRDGDGVNNDQDTFPDDATETSDLDGDGIGDNTDTDRDGDGISNDYEEQLDTDPNDNTSVPADLDTDGIPDDLDDDRDGDNVNNTDDLFPDDPEEATDLDGDGVGDYSDTDRDGDGISNDYEKQVGTDPNDNESVATDSDTDGIPDSVDDDRDGDGVSNDQDTFPDDRAEVSDLDGDGVGDNADEDRDGDGVNNANDLYPDNAAESADSDGDGIADNADNDRDGDGIENSEDYFPDDPNASSVPTVTITSPRTLTTVGSSPITLVGTVDDANATIIVNGVEVQQIAGTFTADVTVEEGSNNIIVRAINQQNHEGTATITVSLDKTPPYITFKSPKDGDTVYTDAISVSGLVNDIVRGTVSEDEAVVTVNGITASVSNRSYFAENVILQEGENTITVTAADNTGNLATETITVNYQPQTSRVIELVSGQAQIDNIQENLGEPLVVRLLEDGLPVVAKTVVFRVVGGDGVLEPGTGQEDTGAIIQTDIAGQARVNFKLGSRAGEGNHQVRARAVGYEGEVIFYASAAYGDGIQMGIIDGNNQRGAIKQPLPKPLVFAVTDAGANLIPGALIEFEVTQGSGTFDNGETTFSTLTDMDGRASASFILGPEEGLDVQRVIATLVGTESTAGFTASAFVPGDPGQTSISGVVLDNQDRPMPGVTVRIEDSTRQAIADEQGQFTITEAPVGPVHLIAEGSTTSRSGEWPSLSYNIVTVPGVDNPLNSPIYLVEIDTENAVLVGAQDVIVTHPNIPGFKLDVKAGSVTFPDGSKEGNLSITQVNSNKIPMPPPNGMQPQLIVTIQPHGAKFDPPARLTIPNTDGHAPGAEIEMYSYDHDLEEFVTIGLGTVSSDGAEVTSNPGSGVIKAGWHCGSQPGGSGCCESPPDCGYCYDVGGGCPGNCELAEDRPAENQVEGNCAKELCGGSEDDPSDLPEDNPHDCVDPICVQGPPAPDDSEVPEGDCMECKGGSPSQITDHVQKREQEPDDCLVLYCDGDHEDAPGEPLPQSQQQPNDCQELKCDGTSTPANDPKEDVDSFDCRTPSCDGTTHSFEPANQPKKDTDMHDCKRPICDGMTNSEEAAADQYKEDTDLFDCMRPVCDGANHGEEPARDQHKEEEIVGECKKIIYQCVDNGGAFSNEGEEEMHSGTPLISSSDKCKHCEEGELIDYDGWLIQPSITKQISAPAAVSSGAEALLKRFGISYSGTWAGQAQVQVNGCCDSNTGEKGEEWTGSIGVGGSVTADIQLWPCTGCPPPQVNIDVGGSLAYIVVRVEVQGGVFGVGTIGVQGQVARKHSDCTENCTEASLNATGSLGVVGRLTGSACYAQGGVLLPDISACAALGVEAGGQGAVKGTITGSTCNGINSNICFEGLSASIKLIAEVTYQGIKYGDTLEFSTPKVLGNCQ